MQATYPANRWPQVYKTVGNVAVRAGQETNRKHTNEGKGRTMNVDEAMAYTRRDKDEGFWPPTWSDDMYKAMVTLAAEVERLRAELAEAKAENVGLAESHYRVEVELASAKAASVCPVKVHGCFYSVAFDHFGLSSEAARRFDDWLRERMKDKSPPQA